MFLPLEVHLEGAVRSELGNLDPQRCVLKRPKNVSVTPIAIVEEAVLPATRGYLS